jgi:26S proteasome regulatory subunit N9
MESLPQEIRVLHEKRLWHELTEALLKLDSTTISSIWSAITQFHERLNKTKLVLLAMKAIEVQDPTTAFVFLDNLSIIDEQASILLSIAKSAQYLRVQSISEAQSLLEDVQKQVERQNDLESVIYSHLYGTLAQLYQLKSNYELFYKYSLQYLAYTPQSEVKDAEGLAYRLAVSVLLAESIYNLGELINQPVLKSLETSKNAWLYTLIHLCNAGKVKEIEEKFANLPEELRVEAFVRKTRILAMLEYIFVGNKRNLSFQELAVVMNVTGKDVEHLVMKAMALGLIKGEIDEVEQVVSVGWLQPRVLDAERISLLNKRMSEWKGTICSVLRHLEDQSKELLE